MSKKLKLYKHQKEALSRVLTRPYFALFMEAGTGKTPVAIKAIRERYLKDGVNRVWIAVPKTLIENWESEIHKFIDLPRSSYIIETLSQKKKDKRDKAFNEFIANDYKFLTLKELKAIGITGKKSEIESNQDKKLMILLVNYEKARVMYSEINRFRPQFSIMDESQKIKSRNAEVAKNTYYITRRSDHRLILTGTPLCVGFEDIFMQFKVMDDTIIGSNYKEDFEERYIRKGGYMGKEIIGYKNLKRLRRKIDNNSFRVLLDECVDLPTRLPDVNLYVDMGSKAQKAYKEMLSDLESTFELMIYSDNSKERVSRSRLKKLCRQMKIPYDSRESYAELFYKVSDFVNTSSCDMAVTKSMRLQQISGGFLTMDSGDVVQLDTAKIRAVTDYISEHGDNPLLIFCQYLPEIDALYDAITKMNLITVDDEGNKHKSKYRVATFSGKTKDKDRVYRSFQSGDIQILILQIDAGGVGLNLQRANRAIVYSWKKYDSYYQMIGRIKRNGQKNPFQIIRIIARDTNDLDTLKAIEAKHRLFSKVMD